MGRAMEGGTEGEGKARHKLPEGDAVRMGIGRWRLEISEERGERHTCADGGGPPGQR